MRPHKYPALAHLRKLGIIRVSLQRIVALPHIRTSLTAAGFPHNQCSISFLQCFDVSAIGRSGYDRFYKSLISEVCIAWALLLLA